MLRFENTGTCLIVRQYLDRARNTMQRDLNERFRVLLEPASGGGMALGQNEPASGEESVGAADFTAS